ncbi:MAG: PilZ domain-containing protein [Gammaproteobacteria bacterium]|nr:PilZ domain-containing protein [Gammaproteobacteria bacterium]
MGELQDVMPMQRRTEARMEGLALQVGMRKLNSTRFKRCALLNVTQGGLGLLTDNVNFRILKPIELRVDLNEQQFIVRGVIAYRQLRMEGMQYGVIFTHVPFELERLLSELSVLLGNSVQGEAEQLLLSKQSNSQVSPLRRFETRYRTLQLQLKVRRRDQENRRYYSGCSLLDISRTGIGFIADELQTGLAGEVELGLMYGNQSFCARGKINYRKVVRKGVRYGVEFSYISSDLLHMIALQNQS